MAVSLVYRGQGIPQLDPPELPEDCIYLIFKELIVQSIGNIPKLATVCKQWRQILDDPFLGRHLFRHSGLTIPQNRQTTWQHGYRLAVGNFFINDLNIQPTMTTISYSPSLHIEANGCIAWIRDRGFIHYDDQQFNVCLLATPHQVHSCITPHPISTLGVYENTVICGLASGDITLYSIEPLKPIISWKAHQEKVEYLCRYEQDWISVSSSSVIRSNPANQTNKCVSTLPPQFLKQYPYIQYYNHHLIFSMSGHSLHSSIYNTGYAALPLNTDANTLTEIEPLSHLETSYTIYGWGNTIAFFDNRCSITSLPFDPSHQYGTSEGKIVSWLPLPFEPTNPSCIFRGDVAFIISRAPGGDADDTEELTEDHEDLDDTEDSDKEPNRIRMVDLRGDRNIVYEYLETSGIGVDESDTYLCHIEDNKFLYFRCDSHEIVILDFPIVLSAEPLVLPSLLPKNENLPSALEVHKNRGKEETPR